MSPLLILFNGPSITTYESSYAFLHHVFFSLCLNIFLNVLPFSLSIFHYLMHCSFSLFLLCHSTLLIVILLPFFLFLPISTVPWSTFQLQTTRHAPFFVSLVSGALYKSYSGVKWLLMLVLIDLHGVQIFVDNLQSEENMNLYLRTIIKRLH